MFGWANGRRTVSVFGVFLGGTLACAPQGPRMQSLGRWGVVAPRVYRDRATRDEATILIETPSWIAIFEHSRAPGTDRLRLIYPLAGDSTPKLPAGRHRIQFRRDGTPEWVPSSALLILALDHPLSLKALRRGQASVSPQQPSGKIVTRLVATFQEDVPNLGWEGFLYHLDMWRPQTRR